jgi:hypothetical protein
MWSTFKDDDFAKNMVGSEVGKSTIYYTGDWKNNAKPYSSIGSWGGQYYYLKYSINRYTRVPLVRTSLRCGDYLIGAGKMAAYINDLVEKDLFNMLYGSAQFTDLDREHWEAKYTFIDSYKSFVHGWLQQSTYDELVSHRFVTKDHKSAESVFFRKKDHS